MRGFWLLVAAHCQRIGIFGHSLLRSLSMASRSFTWIGWHSKNAATVEELVRSLNQYADLVRGKEATRECPVCKKQFAGVNETCGGMCQAEFYPAEVEWLVAAESG